jgi:hypothetical protein
MSCYLHILNASHRVSNDSWKHAVEAAIKKVIMRYYKAPPSSRSASLLLKFVHQSWNKIDKSLFDSVLHYYTVLAKTVDHLLCFLHSTPERHCRPFLLFKRIEVRSKKLVLDIDVGYMENGSYTIKKFVLEDDEQFQKAYTQLALIVCKEVFRQLPQKIEFYSLLNGKHETIFISENGGLTPTALKG